MGDGCIAPWPEHTWTLAVEEGQASLSAARCGPHCIANDGAADLPFFELPETPVTFAMATECPAYPTDDLCRVTGKPTPLAGYEVGSHYIAHGTRCDCNWWAVVEVAAAPAQGVERG